ncbi:hypothetical protein [Cetobacterium sp.]|uniref:hypothetical protein n=1 Tax=Cetobacterium sp. TaxID=2071632 RepID=UPI003F3BFF7F
MDLKDLKVEIKVTEISEVIETIKRLKSEIESLQRALESKNGLVSTNMMLEAKIDAYEDILKRHNIDERPR